MKKVFINIQAKIDNFDENYKIAFLDIKEKFNLEIYNFYIKGDILEENIQELNNIGINMIEYFNEDDLLRKINILKNKNKKYFFNTYTENLIPITNQIKKNFGQKISDFPELFRNKKLQRELLLKGNSDITVKFFEKKIKELNFEEIKNKIGVPFILKPKDGVQSSGVNKIKNKKELLSYIENNNLDNYILVEEFIDGNFYNINYFVDEKGIINYVSPIREIVAIEYGIDDFFSPSRVISEGELLNLNKYNIEKFIKNSVEACGIRNTFIHQEFKITTKNKIKNIELNGRIGGYRMEMYRKGFGINLLELMFSKNKLNNNILYNIGAFTLYPDKNGILKSYNNDLLDKIKKLDSFDNIELYNKKFKGKKIGLTKNGFKKIGKITLKNKNFDKFKKDYNFIKDNYKKILILEK